MEEEVDERAFGLDSKEVHSDGLNDKRRIKKKLRRSS